MSKFEPELWGGSLPAANLTLYSTAGIGTSDYISFKTGSQSERLKIDTNGNVVVGSGALATNASNGFFYIPSSAGTPIGTPTSQSGRVPIDYDSTNDRLYFYSGGAWKLIGSTGTVLNNDYTVEDFGAVGDGTTDDTAAIQDAIDAAIANGGGTVYFRAATYKFTSTLLINANFITLEGKGRSSTLLHFVPTADDTAIEINSGASITYYTTIQGLEITSPDTTYTKIAVDAVDVDHFIMDDVRIDSNVAGYWSGGAGSIGLRTNGRDFIFIRDGCVFGATRPIVIAGNPNSTIDFDHCYIQAQLVADGNPCIEVEDGAYLSNSLFSGSWNLGTHGFYFSSTTSVATSHSIRFHNLRTEQRQNASSYSIYWDCNLACNGFSIDNCTLDNSSNGIYLRGAYFVTLKDILYGSLTGVALDFDDTVNVLNIHNCYWQQGSTANIGGSIDLVYKTTNMPPAGPLPGTAQYIDTTFGNNFTVDKLVVNTRAVPDANDGATLGISGTAFSDLFLASGAVINFDAGDVTVTHSANALAFAGASSGYFFDAAPVVAVTGGTASLTVNAATASNSARINFQQSGSTKWLLSKQSDDSLLLFDTASVMTAASGGSSVAWGRTLTPISNDGAALGTGSLKWSDLFLASGGVLDFNNGDVTVTHSANTLAFAGASSGYTFDAGVTPSANDAAALGTATVSWADIFLASGAVVNFNNGDVTLTHSTDTLTIAGPGTLVLAAGTTAVAPLKFQSGTNLSTAADGAMEWDGQALFFSPDASDRRVIPAVAITRLHAAYTLADSTSAQKMFNASANGALTLPTGSYIFECVVGIDAMSGTSGNAALSIIGAGGATVTNTLQVVVGIDGAKATAGAAAGASWSATNDAPAANTSVVTAGVSTEMAIMWKGSFEVTGAGTIIPSVDLITGGVTPAVKLGSYFMCWRMGAATDVTQGNWS